MVREGREGGVVWEGGAEAGGCGRVGEAGV